jgi:hypothetical protein
MSPVQKDVLDEFLVPQVEALWTPDRSPWLRQAAWRVQFLQSPHNFAYLLPVNS